MSILNDKELYNLVLKPIDNDMFLSAGKYKGKRYQRRIQGPRFPIVPQIDLASIAN